MATIFLTINDGRTVRNLVRFGCLGALTRETDLDVVVLTRAARVEEVRSEIEGHGAVVELMHRYPGARETFVLNQLRQRARHRGPALALARLERWRTPDAPELARLFDEHHPAVVVSSDARGRDDAQLLHMAARRGIPTAALVQSWDNVLKRLYTRPDHLLVWNHVNREEAERVEHYRRHEISVVGAPDFDPYFWPESELSRDELSSWLGVSPDRPLLVFATEGTFEDETFWLDLLLDARDSGQIDPDLQIVCRLHPSTRLPPFLPYEERGVVLDFPRRYLKALGWTMDRTDAVHAGSLFRHADIIVTPASTIVLEAAIFDTPTAVPIFSTVEPEAAAARLRDWVFSALHYRRIHDLGLVDVCHDRDALVASIARQIADPGSMAEQRARLVRDYVQFTDGRSGERLASAIAAIARDERT